MFALLRRRKFLRFTAQSFALRCYDLRAGALLLPRGCACVTVRSIRVALRVAAGGVVCWDRLRCPGRCRFRFYARCCAELIASVCRALLLRARLPSRIVCR